MYTEKELSKLIEDVEKEFTTHLAKAEEAFKLAKSESESATSVDGSEPLAKAEEEKPAKAEEKVDESKEEKEAPKAEEKPAAEAKEAPKADEAPAKEEDKEEAPAAAEGESHGYDAEDMAHMEQMYASMSRAELIAHHNAVKKALDACSDMDKCGDMAQEAAPLAKSEEAAKVNVATEEVTLLKSEISAKDAKIEELKKTLDVVQEFIGKLAAKKAAPAGKAITSLDVIAKSEGAEEVKELTKSEIDSILTKKAADPSLKKSDRDAINAFYLNGASINSIRHLLK